jgi:AhpD family alkylhydroperoxidase
MIICGTGTLTIVKDLRTKIMARIASMDNRASSAEIDALIEFAEHAKAPDPRMVRILARSENGVEFLKYWTHILYEGALPHRLKEIVRIYLSAAEGCAYCTSVRSTQGRNEGVTDELLLALDDIPGNPHLSDREKVALQFAKRLKSQTADDDEAFVELKTQFSEEEIIELGLFCGAVIGAGGFAKTLRVVNWGDVCELRPELAQLQKIGSEV